MTLPIWDATAGYFASKRDNPAMHIRLLPVVISRRIYHNSSLRGIMGHCYSVLSAEENAPTFPALQIRPLAVSYEILSCGDSRGKT